MSSLSIPEGDDVYTFLVAVFIFVMGLGILARLFWVRRRWQKITGTVMETPGEYIVVRYRVEGGEYTAKLSGAAGDIGQPYNVYVNPNRPGKASDAGLLMPFFGVAFTGAGAAAIWQSLSGAL